MSTYRYNYLCAPNYPSTGSNNIRGSSPHFLSLSFTFYPPESSSSHPSLLSSIPCLLSSFVFPFLYPRGFFSRSPSLWKGCTKLVYKTGRTSTHWLLFWSNDPSAGSSTNAVVVTYACLCVTDLTRDTTLSKGMPALSQNACPVRFFYLPSFLFCFRSFPFYLLLCFLWYCSLSPIPFFALLSLFLFYFFYRENVSYSK